MRLNLKTFRFAAGMLVCLSVMVVSGVVSIHDFQQRFEYCQSLERTHQQNLREAGTSGRVSGLLVFKPTVLSLISEGVGERFGLAARIPGRSGPVEVFGRTNANSFLSAFPWLDLAHLIGLLLTLLALLFTYDAVSGEREAGTLQLSLANYLPRYQIILGEYLGALLSLAWPLLGSFLLWLALVRIYGGIVLESADWWRVLLVFLVSVLAVSLFALLGIVVSCSARQSSTSIMLCLFGWIFLAGLYSDLSSWVATRLHPIRPNVAQELGPNRPANPRSPSKAEIRQRMTLPPDQFRARVREEERQSRELARRFVSQMEAERDLEFSQMVSQAQFVETVQNLSPVSAYVKAAAILSGTDLGGYIRFRREARRLDHELAEWQEKRALGSGPAGEAVSTGDELHDRLQSGYRPESLPESLARTLVPLSVILGFHLIGFWVALSIFLRYDPR